MKILMFGRGVIATQYGWVLEQTGNTVEFYVRPGRIAQYGPTVSIDILDGRVNRLGLRTPLLESLKPHLQGLVSSESYSSLK